MGGPGAILDGSGSAQSAFDFNSYTGSSTSVTIEYLTIENFTAAVGQDVVNADSNVELDDRVQHR